MDIDKRTREAYGLTFEETQGWVRVLRALGLTDNQIVAHLKDEEARRKKEENK